jgi:hypothetical protein
LPATVKAHPHNLERVLTALEKRGVTIEEDGREAEALSTTSRLLRNDETHVAFMLHGGLVSSWKPLEILDLRSILEATPSEHLTFLVNQHGKPFKSANSFGQRIKLWAREAGLRDCPLHGPQGLPPKASRGRMHRA